MLVKWIPLALFCAAVGRFMLKDGSLLDLGSLAVLGALAAFYEQRGQDQEHAKLQKRCDALDAQVTLLLKGQEDLKSSMSAVRVASQLKPQSISRL